MFFWFILILGTVVIVCRLVHAFGKGGAFVFDEAINNNQSDIAVYKSQLTEIDNEEFEEKISPENAKEARLELARRIIFSKKQACQSKLAGSNKINNDFVKFIVFIGILFIIAGSWGVYLLIGNPDLPQKPFEVLMSKDDATLNLSQKIVKNEALLARNPNTGILMDKLGDYYLEAERFHEAANIFNRSLGVNGENFQRFLSYGIALTGAENGVVTNEAEKAFRQAIKLEPNNPQPQIFVARGLIQNGKQEQAVALLQKFVEDHGKGQAWAKDMQKVIDQLKEDAQKITIKLTKEQHDFIANNVGKLEEKINQSPQDVKAWVMLINAYFILEQPEKLRSAYNKALRVLSTENKEQFLIILNDNGFAAVSMTEAP